MVINIDSDSLPVMEALANSSRLKIINLISNGEYNIKQIAEELFLSVGMVSRHIKQLEDAGIVKSKFVPTNSGVEKICTLAVDEIYIQFPKKVFPKYQQSATHIGVGTYSSYKVEPTCGLASPQYYIGKLDQPTYFMAADRMQAELIWMSSGFLEYTIPNSLDTTLHKPEQLEISLEIASEFPTSNNSWESDLEFFINDKSCGIWTIPGNYSDVRGKLNPDWWPEKNSQYGLLKTLRITETETLMDAERISDFCLDDIDFSQDLISIRFQVEATEEQGGLTIFGRGFGNYAQDIVYRIYYSDL